MINAKNAFNVLGLLLRTTGASMIGNIKRLNLKSNHLHFPSGVMPVSREWEDLKSVKSKLKLGYNS